MSRSKPGAGSLSSKLQTVLSQPSDLTPITPSVPPSSSHNPLYPPIPIQPHCVISEQDAQLISLSRILKDTYESSGYYISDKPYQANEVDRYSDRYRIVEQNKRQLFDEKSLSMNLPPELNDLAQMQKNKRKKLVETQQKFIKSLQMRNANVQQAGANVVTLTKNEEEEHDSDASDEDNPDNAILDGMEDLITEEVEMELGDDDYENNYFDNGEDEDETAFGKDEGPTLD